MLFIGSMIGLVISDNLLQMFIFWEMVGLCSYALIAFWYKRPESINAGVKVFIMTRIGDISLLAAIGILYAGPMINGQAIGSFSFRDIIAALTISGKRRNFKHQSHGYSCILSFRWCNRKICSTPIVHLALQRNGGSNFSQRSLTRCHNG